MRKATAPKPPSFAALVQQFFTEYLVAQRAVSPRTVACYRDALMLFLDFASRKLGKAPTAMRLADIQPDLILAFLDHLEHGRKDWPVGMEPNTDRWNAEQRTMFRAARHVHHFRISSAVFHVRRVQRRQQCLYFLPLPHGQGSLRPTLAKLALLQSRIPRLSRARWMTPIRIPPSAGS